MPIFDDSQIERFVRDGFVKLEQAFPRSLADECRELLWTEIGLKPDEPNGWTEPVVFVWDCPEPPFVRAANTPMLHQAFDQLVGAERWEPRRSLGWFCIRFPSLREPPDGGWHVDGSYPTEQDGIYGLNVRSRRRALLMLFLFSDVGPQDAPTALRVGSHLDVPLLLAPAGADGMTDRELLAKLTVTSHRPVDYAVGSPGDVYLCHPFLVHTAQPHQGTTPRFMAQPTLGLIGELELDQASRPQSPVEQAVRLGLGVS